MIGNGKVSEVVSEGTYLPIELCPTAITPGYPSSRSPQDIQSGCPAPQDLTAAHLLQGHNMDRVLLAVSSLSVGPTLSGGVTALFSAVIPQR